MGEGEQERSVDGNESKKDVFWLFFLFLFPNIQEGSFNNYNTLGEKKPSDSVNLDSISHVTCVH